MIDTKLLSLQDKKFLSEVLIIKRDPDLLDLPGWQNFEKSLNDSKLNIFQELKTELYTTKWFVRRKENTENDENDIQAVLEKYSTLTKPESHKIFLSLIIIPSSLFRYGQVSSREFLTNICSKQKEGTTLIILEGVEKRIDAEILNQVQIGINKENIINPSYLKEMIEDLSLEYKLDFELVDDSTQTQLLLFGCLDQVIALKTRETTVNLLLEESKSKKSKLTPSHEEGFAVRGLVNLVD